MELKKFENFYFESFNFDLQTLTATFLYSFDEKEFFEEKIYFKNDDFKTIRNLDLEIIENFLFSIHMALGVSYYKFFPTKNLIIKSGKLDEKMTFFWHKFYLNGLGEYFYRNNLSPKNFLNFVSLSQKIYQKKYFETSHKYLVPIGGGKDSIVSLEILERLGKKIDLFTFSSKENILFENTTEISGKKRLFVKRQLSSNIMDFVEKGYYNGHVPITGIIAFVMQLTAYLYDYKYLVLSNEKSANFGNTFWEGFEINHQWSKSLDFELEFREYTSKYLGENIVYFSILRPFFEIKIAEIFSKFSKKYFSKFSSCNKNFKIFTKNNHNQELSYWCNSCPKCAFVYAILRPYLSTKETFEIFGKELYQDESLEKLFRELAGISGIKPFECVGTNKEVILSMKNALKNFEKTPYFLNIFLQEIDKNMSSKDYEDLEKELLIPDFEHTNIPKELLQEIKNII